MATENISLVIKQLEAAMTRYQLLMDRARESQDWETYGEAKRAFAVTWDELNAVKAQQAQP